MNTNPPTQHLSASDKRPTKTATRTKQDEEKEEALQRARDRNSLKEWQAKRAKYKQMFLDKLNKEKKEKE